MYSLKIIALIGFQDAIWVHPNINGKILPVELNTGLAISVINKETYEENFSDVNLTDTDINLRTYSGESIAPLGVCTVTVDLNDQKQNLNLYVVRKGGPPLFGREWLRKMKLNWAEIKAIETLKKGVDGLLDTYRRIFGDELGTLEGINARSKLENQRHQNSHCGLRWSRNWIV